MRRNREAAAAFTLLELLLVMALLALMAGLAAPRLSATVRNRYLQEGAQDLMQLVQSARREAVQRGLKVRFMVDPRRGEYEIRLQNPEHSNELEFVDFDEGALSGVRTLPDGVSFVVKANSAQGQTMALDFEPTGVGDPYTLEMKDRRGRRAVLKLGCWFEEAELAFPRDASGLIDAPVGDPS